MCIGTYFKILIYPRQQMRTGNELITNNQKLLEPRVMQPPVFDAAIYKLPFVLVIGSLSLCLWNISLRSTSRFSSIQDNSWELGITWLLKTLKLIEPRVMQLPVIDAAIYRLPFVLGISSLSPSVFEITASEVLPDSHLSKTIDENWEWLGYLITRNYLNLEWSRHLSLMQQSISFHLFLQ